ncbi:hypothetical protein PMAG_b0178 [Pseudoalteromonas mariniglutinosa NCIMB 1770]|nr:hypothetical protein [Pseudoalteromonas mariniglutinosa NCIMB 1770]
MPSKELYLNTLLVAQGKEYLGIEQAEALKHLFKQRFNNAPFKLICQ